MTQQKKNHRRRNDQQKIQTRLEIYEQIQRDRSETHGTEQTKDTHITETTQDQRIEKWESRKNKKSRKEETKDTNESLAEQADLGGTRKWKNKEVQKHKTWKTLPNILNRIKTFIGHSFISDTLSSVPYFRWISSAACQSLLACPFIFSFRLSSFFFLNRPAARLVYLWIAPASVADILFYFWNQFRRSTARRPHFSFTRL